MMKRLIYLSAILLLTGCIKDPPLPDPPGHANWLIQRTTMIDAWSEDGNFPLTRFDKYVNEYRYNAHNKPISRREYANTYVSTDTAVIALTGFDTLYYDNLQRLVRLDYFSVGDNRIMRRKVFHYNGNSRQINREEQFSVNRPADTLQRFINRVYIYSDTAVLAVQMSEKGPVDTTHYVYEQGNYAYWYSPGAVDRPVGYYVYDSQPNVERCFNLEQASLVFTLPQGVYEHPQPSRNNWTYQGNTPDDGTWRTIIYNENDLVFSTRSMNYNIPSQVTVRYEYIPKN